MYIRRNQQIFGGTLVLLSGDFSTTLPVISRLTPADGINACLKSAFVWRHVQKLTLNINMRAQLQSNQSEPRFSWQLILFSILIRLILLNNTEGHLSLLKITTRLPKPKDIGLIFDVTVKNVCNETGKQLEFRIEPDGFCRLNISSDIVLEKMGQVVGGNFGFIEPNSIETVSVIWPTMSLFNRVGTCPITIISKSTDNKERYIREIIKFDTRFEYLDPGARTLRKKRNFVDCKNWDKDYFKNCTPVDCQERYFGRRNFYNKLSQRCEEVPKCNQSYQVYDIITNDCINTRIILADDALYNTDAEKYDSNVWENEEYLEPKEDVSTDNIDHEYMERFNENLVKKSHHGYKRNWWSFYNLPDWAKGLCKALLIVFATIAIYCLICFGIFLIVALISRSFTQAKNEGRDGPGIVLTPQRLSSSEENIPIYTTSSLMSHR